METYTPFCGTPPIPTELLTRWTFDPVLLAGLAVALAGGLRLAENRQRFGLGWGLVAFLFISPLCAASMALFSARVAQHVLLTLVAAPVIAAALPHLRIPAWPAAITFAMLFWLWHAPGPYQATLESDGMYWLMHLSLLASAIAMFAAFRSAPERAVLAAAFTGAQLTFYAMILTLAPTVWHGWHMLTTIPYGLTPLADQQLAGGLMWIAGGALFLGVVGRLAWQFLRDVDQPMARKNA